MQNDLYLRNKLVVVTGGGRGIGRAIALCCAQAGAAVAIAARTAAEIDNVAAEIGSFGGMCLPFAGDLTEINQVERFFNEVRRWMQRPVDILVNNAGSMTYRSLVATSLSDIDEMIQVNVAIPFLCSQAAAKDMIASRNGTIINILSQAAHKIYDDRAAYCISKHAALGLHRSQLHEYRKYNIRVFAVSPGGVNTALIAQENVDEATRMTPEEVAETVMWLLGMNRVAFPDEVRLNRFVASLEGGA